MAQNYWMDDSQQNSWYGENTVSNGGQNIGWGQFDYSQGHAQAPGMLYLFPSKKILLAASQSPNNYYDQQNYSQNNYYGEQMFIPNQNGNFFQIPFLFF